MKKVNHSSAAAIAAPANNEVNANASTNAEPLKTTLTVTKGGAEQEQPKKKPEPVNPLQYTLKSVEGLQRLIKQRKNLIDALDTLREFNITQVEDENGGEYVGCEISITDDNGNEWSTKNTNLIAKAVAYILTTGETRLIELESEIRLPAAA